MLNLKVMVKCLVEKKFSLKFGDEGELGENCDWYEDDNFYYVFIFLS